MQLCYRGAFYDYHPTPIETINSEVDGKYRGLPWIRTQVKRSQGLGLQPRNELNYRGVSPRRKNIR
jgi:hypothetical protein